MIDENVLEKNYKERLEENLISYLAERKQISLQRAMDIYYNSQLADKIGRGEYGVQYLDYRVLTDMLCETEPELFEI